MNSQKAYLFSGGHREGARPQQTQPTAAFAVGGVQQFFGPPQHAVADAEHSVDPARVQLRLALRLRRQQLPRRRLDLLNPPGVARRRLARRAVIARRRERQSRVRAAIDEEWRQAVAKGGRRVIDGEIGGQEVGGVQVEEMDGLPSEGDGSKPGAVVGPGPGPAAASESVRSTPSET